MVVDPAGFLTACGGRDLLKTKLLVELTCSHGFVGIRAGSAKMRTGRMCELLFLGLDPLDAEQASSSDMAQL